MLWPLITSHCAVTSYLPSQARLFLCFSFEAEGYQYFNQFINFSLTFFTASLTWTHSKCAELCPQTNTQYEVTAFRSKNDCFALVTFKNVKHHSLSLFKVINSLYLNSSRPPEAGGRFLWFKTPDRPPWIQVFLLSDILIRTVDIHPKIHR